MEDLSQLSAVATIAREKLIRDSENAGKPAPSEQELIKAGDEANFRATYGFDAQRDRNENPIQQGIGAPGRETANHYAGILKYCGRIEWEKAVREIFRRDPARAEAIGLPEPQRAGA